MPKTLLFTPEELRSQVTAFPNSNLAQLRNQICRFWCEYPEWVLAGAGLSVLGSSGSAYPAAALALGTLATLCAGRCSSVNRQPYDPDTGVVTSGGQCVTNYRPEARFYTPSGVVSPWYSLIATLRGPLTDSKFVPSVAGSNPRATIDGFNSISGAPANDENVSIWSDGAYPGSVRQTANACEFRFIRLDGNPDNCGNAPNQYPVPPSSLYTFNIDLAVNNNINVYLKNPPVNLPVILSPVFNNFLIPLFINLGGQRLYFDVDGLFEFSPNITIDLGDLLPDDVDTAPPTLSPEPVPPGVPPGDFSPRKRNPPIAPPEEAPPECELVKVQEWDYLQVEADISNYKGDYVFDDNTGSSVIFAGYVRWTIGGVPCGIEEPVRRVISLFRYPVGVDGYVLSELHGCNLSASIVAVEEDLPKVQYECES